VRVSLIILTALLILAAPLCAQIPEAKAAVGSHQITANYYKAYVYNDHDGSATGAGDWHFYLTSGTGAKIETGEREVNNNEWEYFSLKLSWYMTTSTHFHCSANENDGIWGWDSDAYSSITKYVYLPGSAVNTWVEGSQKSGDVYHYYRYYVINQRPIIGTISGVSSGYINTWYAFTTTSFDSEGDSRTYQWEVDGVTQSSTGNALSYKWSSIGYHTVRVRAIDALGATSWWSTKTVYTGLVIIISELTVDSPNGGESWVRGQTYEVKWHRGWYTLPDANPNVKIELLKAGVVVGTVTSSTANDGSHMWPISATREVGPDYRIKITSTTNAGYTDTSDADFAIVASGPLPTATITVTSPNGGESWAHGTTHPVTWTYTGNPGANVKIELLKAGSPVGTATSSTPIGAGGTGSYSWPISATRAPGTDYKIRVTSTSNPAISDTSNNNFNIID